MFKRKRKFPLPQVKTDYISFGEGLDTETPQWDVPQGRLKSSKNYEIGVRGGYIDIEGYERFDGNPKPSDATYAVIDVTISGDFSVGDTILQETSGATAVVLAVVTTTTPNYLVITKITGTFDATSDLLVLGSDVWTDPPTTIGTHWVDNGGGSYTYTGDGSYNILEMSGLTNEQVFVSFTVAGISGAGSADAGAPTYSFTTNGAHSSIQTLDATSITFKRSSGVVSYTISGISALSAPTEGTAASLAVVGGAPSAQLNGQYLNLAADEYRGDIAVAAGSGDILGITMLNDVDYCFRNNAGGTAADLFKSTSSGWTQIPLGYEISFTSGGTTVPAVGDTITGDVSGETAVLTGVVLESGTWAGGDAVGRFIYLTQSGAFQAEGLEIAAVNVATIAADGTAITLSPSGRYEMVINQFGGEAATQRIYGCDTVNRGFEFDGTTYIPIDTGMTTDTPTHVIVHKNHLFFSYGASAQHSGINTPYEWTPVSGAAELATGDTITNFVAEPSSQLGSALGIHNRNTIHILYGSSSSDWELTKYRGEIGSYPYTAQSMVQTVFQDDRGIAQLRTAQDFGNFQHSTLTRDIQTAFDSKKTLAVASCIVRDKNQYRIFYSDGTAFYITMDGDTVRGIMPILLDHVVTCMYSLEDSAGNEVIKFGSDDGMVYEMDKGTSFDGDNIDAFMFFHFAYSKYLRYIKDYLGIVFEVSGNGYAEYSFSYELGYGSADIPQPVAVDITAALSESRWDIFDWDSFIWDTQSLSPKAEALHGSAENIALIIVKDSDYFTPMRLSGATLRFTTRRLLRE